MQVLKVQSPTFNGIHAQTSKMTRAQRELTARLTDAISYSDAYAKAKNSGVDICIFPKGVKNIKAKFLDTNSESFVKQKNNKDVLFSTSIPEKGDSPYLSIATINNKLYECADKLINKLDDVLSSRFKFEEPNYEKINARDTDMYRLFSELEFNEIDASSSVVNTYLS